MANTHDEVEDLETTTSPSDEIGNLSDEETFGLDTDDQPEEEASDGAPRKKSAEGRISELVAEIKELKEQIAERPVAEKIPAPVPPAAPEDPTAQKAIKFLKDQGFLTQDELNAKIQEIEDRNTLNAEHSRLESVFSGEDGRPKYDRAKVETFMSKRHVYDPEAAYKLMNEEELIDWRLKKTEETTKKRPYVERGSSTAGADLDNRAITLEKIGEWLKTPEGRVKYEQNRDKILGMLARGELK